MPREAAKHLIEALCHHDPMQRLASIEGIQASSFMQGVGWERLAPPLRGNSVLPCSALLGDTGSMSQGILLQILYYVFEGKLVARLFNLGQASCRHRYIYRNYSA